MIWFRKKTRGLQSPRPELREPLFADQRLHVIADLGNDDPDTPWARFHAALGSKAVGDVAAAKAQLREVLELPEASTRVRLQAFACLRELGEQPTGPAAGRVRGVVVEFGADALETLAAYDDRTAFAILRSGAAVDWVTPDCAIDDHIEALLTVAAKVVEHTGPHEGLREPPPDTGHASIAVLTFAGTHVGTGPLTVMEQDPVGGPVLARARELLRELAAKGSSAASR